MSRGSSPKFDSVVVLFVGGRRRRETRRTAIGSWRNEETTLEDEKGASPEFVSDLSCANGGLFHRDSMAELRWAEEEIWDRGGIVFFIEEGEDDVNEGKEKNKFVL